VERSRPILSNTGYLWLSRLNFTIMLFALSVIYVLQWFPIVEIYMAFGLLGMMGGLETRLLRQENDTASRFFLMGIPFSILAALVHIFRFSLGKWFCFFDIGHLLVCGTLYYFWLGAQKHRSTITGKY
jgi:hypothetical protein